MVEVNLKRKFSSGEWKKGSAIKDNVIIVGKMAFGLILSSGRGVRSPVGSVVKRRGHQECVSLLNINVVTKRDKEEERKNYIHANKLSSIFGLNEVHLWQEVEGSFTCI